MLKFNDFAPITFVILWASAFISSKIIIENASPFFALSFRFCIVTLGFLLFLLFFTKYKPISFKSFFQAIISGVLLHGFYLGGVFFALSKGASASVITLIVSLQQLMRLFEV